MYYVTVPTTSITVAAVPAHTVAASQALTKAAWARTPDNQICAYHEDSWRPPIDSHKTSHVTSYQQQLLQFAEFIVQWLNSAISRSMIVAIWYIRIIRILQIAELKLEIMYHCMDFAKCRICTEFRHSVAKVMRVTMHSYKNSTASSYCV